MQILNYFPNFCSFFINIIIFSTLYLFVLYIYTILQMIMQYPNGTIVQTNEGEIGKVIKQNLEMADRPVLEIFKDENGIRIEPKKKI